VVWILDFEVSGKPGRFKNGLAPRVSQRAFSGLNAGRKNGNTFSMKPKYILLAALLSVSLCASAQDWAKARLDKSPRHGEWVDVKNGDRTVQCFVVYPEVKNKATAVIVIHEIFGLTDWARSAADQLAEAGYIAIAPDFLSGMAPNGGKTSDFPNGQGVGEAIHKLTAQQITGDLNAAAEYVKQLPSANGKIAVAGFCWGGGQTFAFACNRPDLSAAFVFYGPPPPAAEMEKIKCPVYGFYGGMDNRISATVPKTETLMKAAGKTYEPVIYEGAGHGFMRSGEQPDAQEPNKNAHDQGWERMKSILKKI
jgi:carboxymethylenebutenolidase